MVGVFTYSVQKNLCEIAVHKKAKGLRTRLLERERETEGERRHCLQTIF